MTKQEFIVGLRQSLSGMEDYEYVNDTVNYYENYIETEIRKGQTETDVIQMLGEPRLIAKSIRASKEEITETAGTRMGEKTESYTKQDFWSKFMNMPDWLIKLIVAGVILGITALVFVVISSLAPVIIVGVVAYVLYRFVKNNFFS